MQTATVAETILDQMGGVRRIVAMVGAKHFLASADGVSFQFPNKARSKANALRVILAGDDTYTVEFLRIGGAAHRTVLSTHAGIYADGLKPLFETQTGLLLSL